MTAPRPLASAPDPAAPAAAAEERRARLARLLREKAAAPRPFELVADEDRARLPDGLADAFPLTRLQAGMLFHSQAAPGTAIYHDIFRHELRCRFDRAALARAAARLAERHPALRTGFALTGYREPLQLVRPAVELPVEVVDLRRLAGEEQRRRLAAWEEEERRRDFDVAAPPLLRLVVHRTSDDVFHLTQSFHHAILDGWSVATLNTELFQLYLGELGEAVEPLPPPPAVGLRQYVALERQAVASAEQRSFWLERLADSPVTDLPRRRRDGAAGPRRVEVVRVPLPDAVVGGVEPLARRLGVSVKAVLLAAHLAVLRWYGGRRDVVTGLVTNGRPEDVDGERAVGLFLNSLPFRLRFPAGTWADLVRATFEAEREVVAHRRYPMAELQALLGRGHLFAVLFTFVNFHVYRALARLANFEHLDARGVTETNYDFQAFFFQDPWSGRVGLRLDWDPDAFGEDQVGAFAACYRRVLAAMVEDPEGRLDAFSPLADDERTRLVDGWGRGAPAADGGPLVPERIAAHAADHASADLPALALGGESLSFRRLERRANAIARRLRERGVGPESIVAVHAGRRLDAVVALLAVWKAGGAFLHLDPAYPAARLAAMLADAAPRWLVTAGEVRDEVAAAAAAAAAGRLAVEELAAEEPPEGVADPGPPPVDRRPEHAAYVVYTSGSTGGPKGVVVPHGALANLRAALERSVYRELPPRLRVSLNGSLSFDTSIKQLVQLAAGHTLVLVPDEVRADATALRRFLAGERVDVFDCTPGQLRLLLADGPLEGPAAVLAGGEAIAPDLWQRAAAASAAGGPAFWNLYGPSECTVDSTLCRIDAEAGPPHVGGPIAGARVRVVDETLAALPPEVPGELAIGGRGVARGYLGRPAATAAVFVPDPWGDGERLYRSGDRARWRRDGRLEFIDRLDRQLKVRGHRVEPAEIEEALARHPAVAEAAVRGWPDSTGGVRLAAYVTAAGPAPPGGDELRDFLRARLPEPMVPASFEVLDAMPRLPGGKLDRAALPAPAAERAAGDGGAPRTATEAALVAVWAEVLGLEGVGIHDDFFAIGGHSLLAMQLVLRMRQELELDVPLISLIENPTIAGLAADLVLRSAGGEDAAELAGLLDEIEGLGEGELDGLLAGGGGTLQ